MRGSTALGARGRRLRGDDGAALVEMTFVAPVLILIFMAMVEYGMFYRDFLNASQAVADGAKYGAIQGPGGPGSADHTILTTIRANIATLPIESIDRIVVFQAHPPSWGPPLAQVPQVCKTGPSNKDWKCNVYRIANVPQSQSAFVQIENGGSGFFDCPSPTSSEPACGWPAPTRQNGSNRTPIDNLGVYIRINRKKVTGMVPVNDVLEVAVIQRLEPGISD
jgi:hypothetical protein